MSQQNLKHKSAEAALQYVQPGQILGVGTGSTVECFIQALAQHRPPIKATVASSKRTEEALIKEGFPVWDTAKAQAMDLYIDGADEVNPKLQLIKGGGGALTREKILAEMSKQFVCIVDQSKLVQQLGQFPLPIEVIPMAQSLVAKQIEALGGIAVVRQGFVTDNGNIIIDAKEMDISDPAKLEIQIESIPGVVTSGLFVRRAADTVLVATPDRINILKP